MTITSNSALRAMLSAPVARTYAGVLSDFEIPKPDIC